MKNIILIIAILLTNTAFAKLNYARGEWGSGGGNALVCFGEVTEARGGTTIRRDLVQEVKENGNVISDELIQYIDSIELFDLYEAKKRRGLNPNPPKIIQIKDSENAFEYVNRVAERFDSTVPYMEELVKLTRTVLPNNNFIMESSAVRYQNDLGSVVIPNDHCVISTMAVQVNYNKFYKVHIDGRLFNHKKHSRLSQAVLILHETVYAFARAKGQKDSGTTRELVKQYITSGEFVTEGSVVGAIYNLDFTRAHDEQWPSELAKVYNESKIAYKAYELFDEYVYKATGLMTEFYKLHQGLFLKHAKTISDAITEYRISECELEWFEHNPAKIYQAAECVIKDPKTLDPARFSLIASDILTKEIDYKVLVDEYSEEQRDIFISETNKILTITQEDKERLIVNYDIYVEATNWSLSSIATYNSFEEILNDNNKRMIEIFDHLFASICISTASSPTGPVIIIGPGTKEITEDRCTQPLLLNNIIPKQ